MSFTDGLTRLRDALGITPKAKIRIAGDFLTKVNLPSMMGRRDAAYDAACKLSEMDIFALDENTQSKICLNMMGILDLSIQDTGAIINILSNPDNVAYLMFNNSKVKLVAKITIGRSSDNDIVIDNKLASRHHASIQKIKNAYYLKDEGSTNGTLLNGTPIPKDKYVKLNANDKISIGTANLVIS